MSRVTIKELRLRNYRAFADARLVLDDVTFLVGRNGAGKSTLMDAFSFVCEAVTDSLGTALERRGNLEGIRRRQPRQGLRADVSIALGFELELHGRTFPVLYGFVIDTGPSRSSFVIRQEILRSIPEAIWSGSMTQFERDQTEFRCPRVDIHPSLDPETLVFPVVAGSHPTWKIIIEALKRVSTHQFSPRAIRDEPPIGSQQHLSRDGNNAGDVLKNLRPADHDWVAAHLAEAVPGIQGIRATARAGRRVIVFEQEGTGNSTSKFEAWMMSDGTLRSLGILLALRQAPRPSIVMLDEIEDSLHPLAHGVLLDAVDAASMEFPVVVSTHSPEILSHPTARGERIRVVQWDEGKSCIYQLRDNVRTDLKPPLTVGRLLRANALWTDDEPSATGAEVDFFKL